MDADVLLPSSPDWSWLELGCLHVPRRHILRDPGLWHERLDWKSLPLVKDRELAGYCQVFHASDPVLEEKPWYGVDWVHAGGCDSDFQRKWPELKKTWLPWNVLHLGVDGRNWCGRVTPRLDGATIPGSEARERELRRLQHLRRQYGFKMEKVPKDVR